MDCIAQATARLFGATLFFLRDGKGLFLRIDREEVVVLLEVLVDASCDRAAAAVAAAAAFFANFICLRRFLFYIRLALALLLLLSSCCCMLAGDLVSSDDVSDGALEMTEAEESMGDADDATFEYVKSGFPG